MIMSNTARTAILSRLHSAPAKAAPPLPGWQPPRYDAAAGRDRFCTLLRGQHATVHETTARAWPADLAALLAERGVTRLMAGPLSEAGLTLARHWSGLSGAPRLIPYDASADVLKDTLVSGTDAGLTGSYGGIAETGSVILWPDRAEPRLLSLLPPLHIALVRASRIFSTLAEAMAKEHWANAMPTNLLLISGPSKTADIEQTLAYGVHGPKDLLILLLTDR